MKALLAVACLTLATAISITPLPKLLRTSQLSFPNLSLKRKINHKLAFEEKLQFLFNLKSQLNVGINQIEALSFAISRAPEFAFSNSRQALATQVNIFPALYEDSAKDEFALLANCADLLELSVSTGCSINKALTQMTEKLITRRNQEHLLTTELASTRATVLLLAGLPVMGAGLGLVLGANSIAWLLNSTGGRICLILGSTFEIVGWLWIRRLLNHALIDAK